MIHPYLSGPSLTHVQPFTRPVGAVLPDWRRTLLDFPQLAGPIAAGTGCSVPTALAEALVPPTLLWARKTSTETELGDALVEDRCAEAVNIGTRSEASIEERSAKQGTARFKEALSYCSATQSFECVEGLLSQGSCLPLVQPLRVQAPRTFDVQHHRQVLLIVGRVLDARKVGCAGQIAFAAHRARRVGPVVGEVIEGSAVAGQRGSLPRSEGAPGPRSVLR